jgi:hypothetical protein
LGQGIKMVRKEVQNHRIQWIHEQVNNKAPIDKI